MVRSLWTGATGMNAQQTNVDTIANNLANVNTTGYKAQNAQFKSLLYQTMQTKTTTANGAPKPTTSQVGLGVRTSSINSIFTQGSLLASARILPAYSTDKDEIIITCDGKDYTLPFPRSLKDEKQTHCLADHVMRRYHARQLRLCPCCQSQHATDFVCPFVVTAGIGLKALQEKYHGENDEYHAIMSKLLCDRLAEALAEHLQEYMQKRLFWGNSGIRMAFGYGACPDHALKVPVLDMLQARERMGLSLTSSNMISPGESICGLIFANTPVKYFNV